MQIGCDPKSDSTNTLIGNILDTDNVLGRTISLISDCKAELCVKIGGGAEEELRKSGIRPVEASSIENPMNHFITRCKEYFE